MTPVGSGAPDDLAAWESANGEIPVGAAVCMYSGWEERFGDDGAMHFPGFHVEAAQFLVGERDIIGIGVDTLSLDYGPSSTFDTHIVILGAGLWGLENLANLSMLMGQEAYLVAGVPRYQEGSGGPGRVLALLADAMM
jgi:kynurenine formamidase